MKLFLQIQYILQFCILSLISINIHSQNDPIITPHTCAMGQSNSSTNSQQQICPHHPFSSLGDSHIEQEGFLPFPDDPNKIVKLRFIFLQQEGDEAANRGGFHLNNPIHQLFIDDVIKYMNWRMAHIEDQSGPNNCWDMPPDYIDTKIRFDIETRTIVDDYYWNNQNGDCDGVGNIDRAEDICPFYYHWYLLDLHDNIRNSSNEDRINIFFTENKQYYEIALNSDGTNAADFSVYSTDCAMFPSMAEAQNGLRIHMVNQYIEYLKHKKHVPLDQVANPGAYWDEHERLSDPFLEDTKNARWWYARSLGSLLLHEVWHTLDLPHTNGPPYWPYTETNCNLMCNENCSSIAINEKQVMAAHKAMSRTVLRDYIDDCPISPHPFEINASTTWDLHTQLYSNNLVIKSGHSLTITNRLEMPPNTKIIVEKGARLIIDGGTVTNSCDNEFWQGIEVWGTANQPHPDISTIEADLDPNHGILIIKNEATIEHANTAIFTGKEDEGDPFRGGIVYINNGTFRNNRRAIEFTRMSATNNSSIENSFFELTTSLSNMHEGFITLWDNHGVTIDNTHFSSSIANKPANGIYSLDASYTINNGYFSDLNVGIAAKGFADNFAEVVITGSYPADATDNFKNVGIGIEAQGVDQLTVQQNSFTQIGDEGIQIWQGRAYTIEDNAFTEFYEGVVTLQSGTEANTIHHNLFRNGHAALTAWGNNEKLLITCNDIEQVNHGISVIDYDGIEQGSILNVQGNLMSANNFSPIDPASNKFALTNQNNIPINNNCTSNEDGNSHFFVRNNTYFTYLHHQPSLEPRYKPTCLRKVSGDFHLAEATGVTCNPTCFPEDAQAHGSCSVVEGCTDNIQNQNETGVDCGGVCPPCPPPPSCHDNLQNQNETGIDCGGVCPPCQHDFTGNCHDNIKNQGESGVDCGGPCPPCSPTPTCQDNIKNQGESGVDCGGPCPPCSPNPSCNDNIKNGNETGVDCGGSCPPCTPTHNCYRNTRQGSMAARRVCFGEVQALSAIVKDTIRWIANGNAILAGDLATCSAIHNSICMDALIGQMQQLTPYIADSNLAIMIKDTTFNELQLTPILAAHTPLSNTIWEAMEDRSVPFSSAAKTTIQQAGIGRTYSSLRTIQIKYSTLNYQKSDLLNSLISDYVAEDRLEEAVDFLTPLPEIEAQQALVSVKIKQKEYPSAQVTLNQLPSITLDDQHYQDLQNLAIAVKSEGKTYADLTNQQLALVEHIAATTTPNSVYARNILQAYYGASYPVELPVRFIQQNNKQQVLTQTQTSIASLVVIPNPAQHQATIMLPDEAIVNGAGILQIFDVTGQQVLQLPVETNQRAIPIVTDELNNGIYFCTLTINGSIRAQAKMVIFK